jgi:hypothetical protein
VDFFLDHVPLSVAEVLGLGGVFLVLVAWFTFDAGHSVDCPKFFYYEPGGLLKLDGVGREVSEVDTMDGINKLDEVVGGNARLSFFFLKIF